MAQRVHRLPIAFLSVGLAAWAAGACGGRSAALDDSYDGPNRTNIDGYGDSRRPIDTVVGDVGAADDGSGGAGSGARGGPGRPGPGGAAGSAGRGQGGFAGGFSGQGGTRPGGAAGGSGGSQKVPPLPPLPPPPGGPPPSVVLECGRSQCTSSTLPDLGITLQPCCAGPSRCGLLTDPIAEATGLPYGCVPRHQPGTFDPACPPSPIPFSASMEGCCTEGLCGYRYDFIGLGCQPAFSSPFDPQAPRSCGSGTGGVGGTGGFGGTGGVAGTGGFSGGGAIDGGVGTPGGGGSAGGGYPDGGDPRQAACLNAAGSDCESCACTHCFDLMVECFSDAGCPQLLKCANQTGCDGAGCYTSGACLDVIDEYGGPFGTSANLALPLFQCLQSAGCPCGFVE